MSLIEKYWSANSSKERSDLVETAFTYLEDCVDALEHITESEYWPSLEEGSSAKVLIEQIKELSS